jgi:O-antigen ligase/tetratricopeptide (TPR) repeat protein
VTRAERVLLALLCALVLFSPIFLGGVRGFEKQGGAEPTLLEAFLWAEGPWWIQFVLAAGVAGAALVVAAERRGAGEPAVTALHPLLLLPFGGIVLLALLQSVVFTVSPEGTRRALAGLFVGGAVLLGALLSARRRGAALVLAGAVAAAFTGSAAYGLFETLLGHDTVLGFSKGVGKGLTGTFLNRSNMAAGAGLAIPLAIVYLRRAPWILPALGILLLAVPLTKSRMGLLAAGAGVAVLGLLAARAVRWPAWAKGLVVLLALGAAGSGVWVAVNRLPGLRERFAQGITPTGFFDVRFPAWRSTLALASRYPVLGTGIGSYEVAIHETQTAENPEELVHAHSEPLEALAEGGILGLALAVLLAAGAVSSCLRAATAEDPSVRSVGCACGGALAALLTGCLVEFHLHVPALGIAAAVLAAIPAALAAGEPRTAPAGGAVKGIAAAAVLSALIAAALGASAAARHGAVVRADFRRDGSRLLLPGEPVNAASWRSLAMALADAGKGSEALAAADRALDLEPYNAYGHWTRAVALLAAGRPPAEAAAAIQTALSRAGGIGHLHLAAGSVLLELSLADPSLRPAAMAALREAGMILPQNFSAAWALMEKLQIPSGERVQGVPLRSHAWGTYATYCNQTGDVEGEIRAWAQAWQLDGNGENRRKCIEAAERSGMRGLAQDLLKR